MVACYISCIHVPAIPKSLATSGWRPPELSGTDSRGGAHCTKVSLLNEESRPHWKETVPRAESSAIAMLMQHLAPGGSAAIVRDRETDLGLYYEGRNSEVRMNYHGALQPKFSRKTRKHRVAVLLCQDKTSRKDSLILKLSRLISSLVEVLGDH